MICIFCAHCVTQSWCTILLRKLRLTDFFRAKRMWWPACASRSRLLSLSGLGFACSVESFSTIEQAMALPRGRLAGHAYLRRFVEEMKASGFVAEALARSGQGEATVASLAQSS
jgi:hypothetical protein